VSERPARRPLTADACPRADDPLGADAISSHDRSGILAEVRAAQDRPVMGTPQEPDQLARPQKRIWS
jgi:hypothetical protein